MVELFNPINVGPSDKPIYFDTQNWSMEKQELLAFNVDPKGVSQCVLRDPSPGDQNVSPGDAPSRPKCVQDFCIKEVYFLQFF
jgi:hypothetical protein